MEIEKALNCGWWKYCSVEIETKSLSYVDFSAALLTRLIPAGNEWKSIYSMIHKIPVPFDAAV